MPGLVRSATEHDIRLRSRRPGPGIEPRPVPPHFHELPPHIRQHMVRLHFMIQRTIYHFCLLDPFKLVFLFVLWINLRNPIC